MTLNSSLANHRHYSADRQLLTLLVIGANLAHSNERTCNNFEENWQNKISKISVGEHTFLIHTQKCMWKKSIYTEFQILPLYQCNFIQKPSYWIIHMVFPVTQECYQVAYW